MGGQEKAIIIECENCGHEFVGSVAPPGTFMRIEAPCPSCSQKVKTPYGVITPFSDRLFYFDNGCEVPPVSRDSLKKQIGFFPQSESTEAKAQLSEIFNAFLIWLDNTTIDSGTIQAPQGHVIYFLPLFQQPDVIRSVLREKLQQILESTDPAKEIAAAKSENAEVNLATSYLYSIIDVLHREGFNLAFLIQLIIYLLDRK